MNRVECGAFALSSTLCVVPQILFTYTLVRLGLVCSLARSLDEWKIPEQMNHQKIVSKKYLRCVDFCCCCNCYCCRRRCRLGIPKMHEIQSFAKKEKNTFLLLWFVG